MVVLNLSALSRSRIDKGIEYKLTAPYVTTLQVFAYGNNVYCQRDPHETAVQLTFTGDPKFIFNGVADWLYEGSYT